MKGKLLICFISMVLGFSSIYAQEWQKFELPDSIYESTYSRVWDLDVDSQDVLWMATVDGIVKWKDEVLERFDKNNTSVFEHCLGNACWAISVDTNDCIWVSGESGLLLTKYTPPDNWQSFTPYTEIYGIVGSTTIFVGKDLNHREKIELHF